ncbi:hypothetical protein [Mesorhizobium sp.]|uniref:hypothetical protein n=1 Tax=Mesorhizobium sp. TaxID=1871066 RepID=UPI000FE869D5|nr:hypothetical protein [Mesorhizobium sp.]RWA70366.1 MAG: hypothetical protein EOQ29_14460 [Mesorhizobium sp.]RWA79721.1 MAG: hypothetical protein EOQ30_25050 [Mesorhizobium sp.]
MKYITLCMVSICFNTTPKIVIGEALFEQRVAEKEMSGAINRDRWKHLHGNKSAASLRRLCCVGQPGLKHVSRKWDRFRGQRHA